MKEEKYLIAWSGANQCFYGKDKEKGKVLGYVDALTLRQAKSKIKRDFPAYNGRQKLKLYKLVEVEDNQ